MAATLASYTTLHQDAPSSPDGGGRLDAPLSLLDPATGRDRFLGTLERPSTGLTVSADAKTILFAKTVGEGSDLVLIENFH